MSSFDYKTGTVIFRDEWVPFTEANVSIASSPVLYGLAVYTVFNVVCNQDTAELFVFRLKDHWQRLVNSCRVMGFEDFAVSHPYENFQKQVAELLRRNKVEENILVRCSVFIDELIAGTRIGGLKNSFYAYIYPMGQFYPKEGAHVRVSSWRHVADNAIPARAKVNGSYASNALIKNEALQDGYDEAIVLDESGHVAEGTVANLFMVKGGSLVTPSSSSDILEGITRDTVMRLAEHLGIPCQTRQVDRSELYTADELFFSGSSARIAPILSVDKRMVGQGRKGEVTGRLEQLYYQVQYGQVADFRNWVVIISG